VVNNRKLSETVSLTEEKRGNAIRRAKPEPSKGLVPQEADSATAFLPEHHYKVRDVVERRREELRKIDHSP
jgi:hypothetical protein